MSTCFYKKKKSENSNPVFVNITFHFKMLTKLYLYVEDLKLKKIVLQSSDSFSNWWVIVSWFVSYIHLKTFLNCSEYAATPLKLIRSLYLDLTVYTSSQTRLRMSVSLYNFWPLYLMRYLVLSWRVTATAKLFLKEKCCL